ncbi:MAG: DMT family transporter [Clostridiaceae bacterium]
MTNELKADLSIVIVTLIWGSSFPLISVALKDMSPYSYVFYRFMISSLIMIILFHKKFKQINKDIIKASFYIGISLFLGTIFQIVGLVYTTASKSGFITGFYVVIVPILVSIIYKRRPENKTVLGVILAFIGLAMLSLNGDKNINIGDILTLICAVFFAVQIVLIDRFSKGKDAILLTTLEMIIVTFLSFFVALYLGQLKINLSILTIITLLYTSIFCTLVGYGLQNKMQPYLKPTHAAIIFLLEPVFGAIFSTFIGDKITIRILIGAIFIFMGMLITSVKINLRREKNDFIL